MSYIRLNEENQQYRVVIRSVKKLPPNPHIGPPSQVKDTLHRALNPPSTDETGSQSRERADAAIMMIFGTHRKCVTLALEFADFSSVWVGHAPPYVHTTPESIRI